MSYKIPILASSIIFFFDRLTKYYILHMHLPQWIINRFISIRPIFNRGISWGIFHSTNNCIFIIVSSAIALITIMLLFYTYWRWRQGFYIGGECLVLAGSFSNIMDRFMYQGVIDFISLSINTWSWPIFNIADVAIVIGIGIMIMQGLKE
ncbi:MAG: signal peptidase II [Candidatus Babeliales bacterium]